MTEDVPTATLQEGADRAEQALESGQVASLDPIPVALGKEALRAVKVSEFPSPGSRTVDGDGVPLALQYPGERPRQAFSLSGEQVAVGEFFASSPKFDQDGDLTEGPVFYVDVLMGDGQDRVWNVDDLLRIAEAPTMEERIPVIAFGSNANPSQLAQKFEKLEGVDRTIVPNLKGKVKGMAPVYVARIGINGYTFTDLTPTSNPDAECEVYINFLSRAQLEAMNATEKAYSLCQTEVSLETNDGEGLKTPAYLYVGRADSTGANILTDYQQRPIRLAELSVQGKGVDEEFGVMTQTEVQNYIFEIANEPISKNLLLDNPAEKTLDVINMIISRNKDPRLQNLRDDIKKAEKPEPLGRVTGRAIQQAIESTGRIAPNRNVRSRLSQNQLDIGVDEAKSFGKLLGPDMLENH